MGDYDAIVIGGGPAGSTVATRLRQRGRSVLLIEKERFPRFHIGESLLPCSMPLFRELGVLPAIESAGFLPKYAAEFVTLDGSLRRRYPFSEGVVDGPESAYEVDRAELDAILLEHAEAQGAEVRQGMQVISVRAEGDDDPSVTVRDAGGHERTLSARVLIDASGQHSLLASRFGLKKMDSELKNFAVFSHYEGAARASGEREGDISIVLVPHGWWWVIPLARDRTSVGLVAPGTSLTGQKPDADYFQRQIENSPYLAERFKGATRIAPVRTVSDYSYVSQRFAGRRWLLVGDAAGFIDPVFSTGVYLGMRGGFEAADAVHRALDRRFPQGAFNAYETWLGRALSIYRDFVRGFYNPEFVEVLMHPSDRLQLRQAVTSLLAGHGIDHFEVTWRIWVFRAITRANKRWGLTPRLPGRREAAELLGRSV